MSCTNPDYFRQENISPNVEFWNSYVGNFNDYSLQGCHIFYESENGRPKTLIAVFYGLLNEKLTLYVFEKDSKRKILEWIDTEKTDINKEYVRYEGYGRKDVFKISSICPYFYKTYQNKSVVGIAYSESSPTMHFSNEGDVGRVGLGVPFDFFNRGIGMQQIIFIDSQQRVLSEPHYCGDAEDFLGIYDAFAESVFVCWCPEHYTTKIKCIKSGDIVYEKEVSGNSRKFPESQSFVSYTDYIKCEIQNKQLFCKRINWANDESVWETHIEAPFEIPEEQKPRISYSFREKDEHQMIFDVYMLYFDGTEKDFSFKVNVEDGCYTVIQGI